MKNSEITIARLAKTEDIPFDLLLLADETVEAIEKYIYRSEVYVVRTSACPPVIAVFVLQKPDDSEIEIKNIAVAECYQSKGIGSYMIREIKRIAVAGNYRRIIVGTPDCSHRLIGFYERNGFEQFGLRKNFYIENYSQPIIEDGIILRDMVMLAMNV